MSLSTLLTLSRVGLVSARFLQILRQYRLLLRDLCFAGLMIVRDLIFCSIGPHLWSQYKVSENSTNCRLAWLMFRSNEFVETVAMRYSQQTALSQSTKSRQFGAHQQRVQSAGNPLSKADGSITKYRTEVVWSTPAES